MTNTPGITDEEAEKFSELILDETLTVEEVAEKMYKFLHPFSDDVDMEKSE